VQRERDAVVAECDRLIGGATRLLERPIDLSTHSAWLGEVEAFVRAMESEAMELELKAILSAGKEGTGEAVARVKGLLEAVRQEHLAFETGRLKESTEELRRLLGKTGE
jgi:hypothetical protein